MPKLYMLVGVPGSGKSTWVKNQKFEDVIIASSDAYIDTVAAVKGKTYSEVFSREIGKATDFCKAQVNTAIELGKDLVWDQTNTMAKGRKYKLQQFGDEWLKVAVFFPTPDMPELERRLKSRVGKDIPRNIMQGMIDALEMPTLSEGFDEIIMLDKP